MTATTTTTTKKKKKKKKTTTTTTTTRDLVPISISTDPDKGIFDDRAANDPGHPFVFGVICTCPNERPGGALSIGFLWLSRYCVMDGLPPISPPR
jgi:hypothetical protein